MDYDINTVRHSVLWKKVSSSCLSIQIAKLMSSVQINGRRIRIILLFTLIRIRILLSLRCESGTRSYHSLFCTDLDPPTQCSRMTPSGFHLFTFMRIRILFSLWCGFGPAILPTCSILFPLYRYYFVRRLVKTAGYMKITFSGINIVK